MSQELSNGNAFQSASAEPELPLGGDPTPVIPEPPQQTLDPNLSFEDYVASQRANQPAPTPQQDPVAPPAADNLDALASPPPAAEPDLAAQLKGLSDQFGLDLTGYSTVNDALNAARQFIALQPPLAAPPAPTEQQRVEQVAQEEDPFNLSLDLEDTYDETTKAYLTKVQETHNALVEEVKQLRAERVEERNARQAQGWNEVKQRANAVVDSVKSDRYGTSESRTPEQQYRLQVLGQQVQNLAHQAQLAEAQGIPFPQIETLVQRAMLLDGGIQGTPQQSVQQPGQNFAQPPVPAPRPLPAIPPSAPGTDFGPNDFHKDPSFLRAAAALRKR